MEKNLGSEGNMQEGDGGSNNSRRALPVNLTMLPVLFLIVLLTALLAFYDHPHLARRDSSVLEIVRI